MQKLADESSKLIKEGQCRIEILSSVMGQSNRTLQRKLKYLLGQAFTEYIQASKLKMAKELLIKGYSVKETAYESGFKDPSYFSNSFKKQFEISPSKFAKDLKAKADMKS